jgi:hypothetical protein
MNLVHFGAYFYVVSMVHFVCVNTKPQIPSVSFLANHPSPQQNPNPPFGILSNLFYFLETDQYGSDLFGSSGKVGILFIYLFIYELNSRAFHLEIKR